MIGDELQAIARWLDLGDGYGDTYYQAQKRAIILRQLADQVEKMTERIGLLEDVFQGALGVVTLKRKGIEPLATWEQLEEAVEAAIPSAPVCADDDGGREGALPRVHDLKCWPGPFSATRLGLKRFEWRKNDRKYAVGDILCLREWDPATQTYSGAEYWCRVTWLVLGGAFDIPDGYCIMSVAPCVAEEVPPDGQ